MDFLRRHRYVLLLALVLGLLLVLWATRRPDEPASEPASSTRIAPAESRIERAPAPVAAAPDTQSAPTTNEVPSSFGTLRGRVIDAATREPVNEFEVEFHGSKRAGQISPGARTFAAEDGRFERHAPAGSWRVTVSAAGYQRFTLEALRLTAGQATEQIVLPLRPGYRLHGRIYDEVSGAGIASANISFREAHVGRFEGNWRMRPYITMQKNGAFVIEGVPAGRITLMVEAQEHAGREVDVTVGEKTGQVEIALATGGAIIGYLAAADGRTPIAGQVGLASLDEGYGGSRPTGDAGEFSFEHLPAGRYGLTGEAGGAVIEREIVLAANERIEGIVLALRAGRSIRGVVTGLAPEELKRVNVSTYRETGVGGTFGESGVDDRGAYVLRGVPPGRLRIAAFSGRRGLWKVVDMPADADLTVDLDFPRGSRVSGRVTRGGEPLAGVQLHPRPRVHIESHVHHGTATLPTGEYVLDGLGAGEYTLLVEGYRSRTFKVPGDTVVDIDIPAAHFSGRVLEDGGKVPIAGATVSIRSADGDVQGTQLGDQSDDFGRFALTGLEPGDFLLTAYKPGYEMHREQFSYGSSVADSVIRLRRDKGVAITAREVGSDKPLARVVAMEMIGYRGGSVFYLELDENGVGYLPRALTGATLAFQEYGYAPITIKAWNGEPLDLHLHPQKLR